jgi:hypothetical protein
MKKLIKKIQNDFKAIRADKCRKSFPHIIYELFKYSLINKELPYYYAEHLLHRKSNSNLFDYYIGQSEIKKIRKHLIDRQLVPFLENKVLFQMHFAKTKIRLPEFIGYNIGRTFIFKKDVKTFKNLNEFKQFIEKIVKEGNISGIFFKPIDGNKGKNCFLLSLTQIEDGNVENIYNKIKSSKYIIQAAIKQHYAISEIYPYSVNTLRIHSCIYKNGQVGVISVFMRFGSQGSIVEAGGLGTIFIEVDIQSGVLGRLAQKNFQYGGQIFKNHPDTGFSFDGFQIPYFFEAINIVKEASYLLPVGLVGWDVAISENGPILIEGNINFGLWAAQIANGGYKANKAFKKLYEEINNK